MAQTSHTARAGRPLRVLVGCEFSGVLREALRRLTLPGYAPAMNYQRELMRAVCEAVGVSYEPPAGKGGAS